MTSSDIKSVLEDHFSSLSLSTDIDAANRIVVRRKHIWNDTLRAFSRSSFDCQKAVNIIFVGEEGADAGGPKHEFFHLALEKFFKVLPIGDHLFTTFKLWPVESFFMLACLWRYPLLMEGLDFHAWLSQFLAISVTDLDQRSNLRWKTYLTLKSKKSLRR